MGGWGIPGGKPRVAHQLLELRKTSARAEAAAKRRSRQQLGRTKRRAHIRKEFQILFRRVERARKLGRVSGIEQNQILLAAHELYKQVTNEPLLKPARLRQVIHESHGGLDVLTSRKTRQAVERWKSRLSTMDVYLKKPRIIGT